MAQNLTNLTDADRAYLDAFEKGAGQLPGAGLDWLAGLRREGRDAFAKTGMPHRRVEIFKYTDLRRHLSETLSPAAPVGGALPTLAADAVADPTASVEAHDIVLVNGFYRPDLSGALPQGVEVLGLADALGAGEDWVAETLGQVNPQADHPMQGLNMALFEDGVAMRVAKDTRIDKPLRLVHLTPAGQGGTVRHTRNLIVLGSHAEAELIEVYRGTDGQNPVSTVVTEVAVGDGARLDHVRVLAEGDAAVALTTALVRVGRDATYDSFISAATGALTRSEVYARFAAPGGSAKVNGTYLIHGKQHADITSMIDHAVPDCVSEETFRAVLDEESTGVFQGMIMVRPDAQRTDGRMLAQALLLSDKAEMDAKPELEIYADDVRCAHGATTGQIDRDALFYLQSRGLDAHEARRLLVESFLQEALVGIRNEDLRAALTEQARAWLARQNAA
jgi:Fe-S cluster assembly protein SufD